VAGEEQNGGQSSSCGCWLRSRTERRLHLFWGVWAAIGRAGQLMMTEKGRGSGGGTARVAD